MKSKRRVYYDPCQEKVVRTIPCYEKKGVACCEHYPEGLPVCSRCREESTLAHDKACALLAEARAEIEKATATEAERWAERLNWLHTKYGADCSGTDSADLLDCVEDEIKQVINSQSELIEQMRDALKLALSEARSTHCEQTILAALAAERGE